MAYITIPAEYSPDSNTKLLLHFENNVTDSSVPPKSITQNGVTFSNSIYKVGSYSAYFAGIYDYYLQLGNSSDFAFGTNNFTIDTRCYFNHATNTFPIYSRQYAGDYPHHYAIFSYTSNVINLNVRDIDPVISLNWAWTPTIHVWYHIALVRNGNDFIVFVNGHSLGTQTSSGSMTTSATGVEIGVINNNGGGVWANGYMDEYRISNIARWTSDFEEEVIYVYATPGCANVYGTINSGLDHLEGLPVAVLADGEVVDGEVVTGGAITTEAAEIKVGLPFTSEFETMNIELPVEDGTLQGADVKVSNTTFNLLNSRGGFIGPNEDTNYEAFTEENLEKATEVLEPSGTSPKLYNVNVRVPLGAGYESGGRVYVKQTDPLPLSIMSVIPEVTV